LLTFGVKQCDRYGVAINRITQHFDLALQRRIVIVRLEALQVYRELRIDNIEPTRRMATQGFLQAGQGGTVIQATISCRRDIGKLPGMRKTRPRHHSATQVAE
jgi:hypothetical protein